MYVNAKTAENSKNGLRIFVSCVNDAAQADVVSFKK